MLGKILLGIIISSILVSLILILKDERQERKAKLNFLMVLFLASVCGSFLLFNTCISLFKIGEILIILMLLLSSLLTVLTSFPLVHFMNLITWSSNSVKSKISGIIFTVSNSFFFAAMELALVVIIS